MSEVTLSAAEHFEALREGVWARLAARPGVCTRERFDEAYAEWWSREVERAASGRPSRASAPVSFLTESVHRALIDEGRARARGLAREEKAGLEVVDLDSQASAASPVSTEGQASYEALVHRILTLVQGSLNDRELRVFVYAYLYLASSERTAEALGLSVPRVKKDREKVIGKVGAQVWQVLNNELDLCAVYDRKALGAVFEILSVHVEDCPTCAAALGGLRKGALSILPPAQLLVLGGGASSESVTDAVSHAYESVAVRLSGLVHRAGEAFAAMPAGGRTAAVVAVAASAVAGGAATVTVPHRRHERRAPEHVASRVTPVPRRSAAPVAPARSAATATAHPARIASTATSRAVVTARQRAARVERERFTATPSATAAQRETIGFESPASSTPAAATSARVAPAPTAPPAPSPAKEFGFEHH